MHIGNYNNRELLEVNLHYLHSQGKLTEETGFFLRRMYNYPHNIYSFIKEVWEAQGSKEIHTNTQYIDNRYTLVCKTPIGSGGMGEVYPFWDAQEQKVVAFKIAKLVCSASGENRRLLREGEVLKRLHEVHPNIVKYQDLRIEKFGDLFSEDAICLVMEYVEGRSLKEFALRKGLYWYDMCRRENRKLDQLLQSNIGYICTIAKALQTLHKKGLVHRDVKPTNIIISDDVPILIDFGIAQRIEAEGYLRTICSMASNIGTPPFMDPGTALSFIDLLHLQKDIQDKSWEEFLRNVKKPLLEYPTKMKPLKKKIKQIKTKLFVDKWLYNKPPKIDEVAWEEVEQIINEIRFCSDPKEDVYSLGATLYWCLTGETLFSTPEQARMYYHNPSKIHLVRRMNIVDFAQPKKITKVIKKLEKIIQHTLNPDPVKRWSCEKLIKALEPFANNLYAR
ncbi:serine/threonine-protein kinase [Candidatus Uabimicrobium amorphum]|uniref:Serine/threonine protein kinase n=1 Tax=Uabimicrobium amorphum TaxID=2596890 RepID=A0A5S9IIW5_UABAM|nr:serine/threonine-protein kinase [Candidatus Uabimicrobium amorphum]BBM82678.1 serine/threonine protein kinase [Candidatus Uabimicrobium amorphum]